jgi:hypothetical protein
MEDGIMRIRIIMNDPEMSSTMPHHLDKADTNV